MVLHELIYALVLFYSLDLSCFFESDWGYFVRFYPISVDIEQKVCVSILLLQVVHFN